VEFISPALRIEEAHLTPVKRQHFDIVFGQEA